MRIAEVSAGLGGSAYLILGSKKNALIDTGMWYCGEKLVNNIKKELNEKSLDYVFLTHSHYDHIGALPYIVKEFPLVKVCGHSYAKEIFKKESAKELIKSLSLKAKELFDKNGKEKEFLSENIKVDISVKEGDKFDLGDEVLEVIETMGHTKCSISFYLNKSKILFLSETTGIIKDSQIFIPCFIVSYNESIKVIDKLKRLPIVKMICPHYGYIEGNDIENFWRLSREISEESKEFICSLYQEGKTVDEIVELYKDKYRPDLKNVNNTKQPEKAFIINTKATIEKLIKEFC